MNRWNETHSQSGYGLFDYFFSPTAVANDDAQSFIHDDEWKENFLFIIIEKSLSQLRQSTHSKLHPVFFSSIMLSYFIVKLSKIQLHIYIPKKALTEKYLRLCPRNNNNNKKVSQLYLPWQIAGPFIPHFVTSDLQAASIRCNFARVNWRNLNTGDADLKKKINF